MLPRNIVAVCGDPGGANALAPVLELLARRGDLSLRAFAYNQAVDVLRNRGIACEVIPADAGEGFCRDALQSASALIAATSSNGRDYERAFIDVARAGGVASLAILDFWSNYRQRFVDASGALVLPDMIAVMDETARAEMIACGFPAGTLVVTGQPAFDALPAKRATFDVTRRASTRQRAQTQESELQLLFVSQPFRALYGADSSAAGHPGYDESGVLAQLITAVGSWSERNARAVVLVIRPHPRETLSAPPRPSGSHVRTVICAAGDQYEAAMAADLVVGMSSVLLLEARHLGCRVLSLQPGARREFFREQADARLVVETRPERIAAAVESSLDQASAPTLPSDTHARITTAAAEKVVECVNLLLHRMDTR